MNSEWLSEGQYKVDIDEIRTNIMKGALHAQTEADTAQAFEREIYYYVRSRTGEELDFQKERQIEGAVVHDFGQLKNRKSGKGRIDALVNNLLIEYKGRDKLERDTDKELAIHQVIDYLEALYKNEKIKYSAILTNGLKICYFEYIGEKIKYTAFKTVEVRDIDIIIRAMLSNNNKRFVPRNIVADFSIDTYTDSISKNLARCLYTKLINNPTDKTEMLFTEWESLMHLSCDDGGKGGDVSRRRRDLFLIFNDDVKSADSEYRMLYALQTTYAIIVKLIACKIIDKIDFGNSSKTYSDLTNVTSDDLQRFLSNLEDGYVYRSSNILNLLEGDFFSWYSSEEQWDVGLWRNILEIIKCIDEYSAFSFDISYNPVDIFKDLYMSIMPKSVRHSMGEYFTPEWLADYVIQNGLEMIGKDDWTALDPCCGSGTFVISLIKHIVGDVNLQTLTKKEKEDLRDRILTSVYGIDINPLSVLSARVGYYLAIRSFGDISDVEIPIYLGDSAIVPRQETIDGIKCYKYSVTNQKKSFDVVFPQRLVEEKNFGMMMMSLQGVVNTCDVDIMLTVIKENMTKEELKSHVLCQEIRTMAENLIELKKNNWDGIWVRISTNYMMIARLKKFDLIVGNPPWVKWEHLPSKYALKIKELCNVKHIFSTRGQYGGTQLNVCALISNVAASNWLKEDGVLAFLMPDSIMSQNSYEEFRYFYIDFEKKKRLYLQKIDKWEKPLRPFRCEDKVVSQDFNTYYFSSIKVNYKEGIDVNTITRLPNISDEDLNRCSSYLDAKKYIVQGKMIAARLSEYTSAFSFLSEKYDYSKIIGETNYEYRTGVEFTPQELYMLVQKGESTKTGNYMFKNKKFLRSKFIVDDMPKQGWDLPTEYIYPIVTGPSITRFHYKLDDEYCILPYKSGCTKEPISVNDMMKENKDLFMYLLRHQKLIEGQSEKSKEMHRGREFYSLSKIGPYTFSRYIVAARDNTKFCATVVTPTITHWGERKQRICVKHTMLIGTDKKGRKITRNEADYICGILNCDIVVAYMQDTFKSNGYSLKKAHFKLPLYDSNNEIHVKIARLARRASETEDEAKINNITKNISELYIKLCEN